MNGVTDIVRSFRGISTISYTKCDVSDPYCNVTIHYCNAVYMYISGIMLYQHDL